MRSIALLVALLITAVGCGSTLRPGPGMAALRVKVIAEPKAGTPTQNNAVSTYDTPIPVDYGPKAKVDYANLDNIVVWIEPTASAAAPPLMPAVNVDVDPRKSSHGIANVVSVGQRVILHNLGSAPQAIYSTSDGNDFELPAVPPAGTAEYTVRSPGPIEIYADTSRDIAVELFAAPTVWARLAHAGEVLEFNNVPPGQYRLVSWHPRLPGTTEPVQLSADRVTDASIKVGVNSLPKVTADAGRQ